MNLNIYIDNLNMLRLIKRIIGCVYVAHCVMGKFVITTTVTLFVKYSFPVILLYLMLVIL